MVVGDDDLLLRTKRHMVRACCCAARSAGAASAHNPVAALRSTCNCPARRLRSGSRATHPGALPASTCSWLTCQMHRLGSLSGCGKAMITWHSPARTVMKKFGNSTQPWLSLICASVRPADVQAHAREGVAGGLLQQLSGGDTRPGSPPIRPRCGSSLISSLEAWKHRDRRGKVSGRSMIPSTCCWAPAPCTSNGATATLCDFEEAVATLGRDRSR